jgi:hypothetical protein
MDPPPSGMVNANEKLAPSHASTRSSTPNPASSRSRTGRREVRLGDFSGRLVILAPFSHNARCSHRS